MPLLDLQRRGRELGRIRIGAQVVKDGKARPVKLDTFRLTTPSRPIAEGAAALFGGEPRPWAKRPGLEEWEVLTGAAELPVSIPPGQPLTQWWELWSGGGLVRRCDGETEQTGNTGCLCPAAGRERADAAAAGRACKPTSRLSVLLPDAPDLGVWLLVTHGYNAALELAGTADLIHRAAVEGAMLPARLRLEQRETRRPGEAIARYAVPVLELGVTLRALAAGVESPTLPPAPAARPAELAPGEPDDAVDVDALTAHALDAATRADVEAIAARAGSAGVLDNLVDTGGGELDSLREVLRRRHRELTA